MTFERVTEDEVKRTPAPGSTVPVSAPEASLLEAAKALGNADFIAGSCENNSIALAKAAQQRGSEVVLVFGHWFPHGAGSPCTHAWVRVDGRDLDPTAALMGLDASLIVYRERIQCSLKAVDENHGLLQELNNEEQQKYGGRGWRSIRRRT